MINAKWDWSMRETMSAKGQMRAALRGEGVSACPSKADVERMRRTRQLWATIRSLNLASRSLRWSTERPPAAWLDGSRANPAVKLGCLRAPTQVGSISVASPPLREAYTRSGLRSCSGALDRLSLKKA